jgi:transposase-like protein
MKKIMKEKNHAVPDEVLSKKFLNQFKTEADVSKFLKQLHAQVLEKMLEGEMDAHLGYEKNSVSAVIPVTAATPRKSKLNTVKRSYLFSMTVTVNSSP